MTGGPVFKFRLYVADGAENSALALANLHALCEADLAGRHEIEVIDVFREPQRALDDGIRMTPTLIKLSPAPTCRIVGGLTGRERVRLALGLGVIAA